MTNFPLLRVNAITALGGVFGLLALALPWLLFKPNRLVLGEAQGLLQLEPSWAFVLGFAWLIVLVLSFVRVPARGVPLTIALAVVTTSSAFLIGTNTDALVREAGEIARVSLAGGVWLTLFALYVAIFGSSLEWRFAWLGPALAALVPIFSGTFFNLGPLVEFRGVQDQFGPQLLQHLALAITSVVTASLIGFPLGLIAARNEKLEGAVLGGAGLLQTIPSLALFGVLLPPLAWLGRTGKVGVVLGAISILALIGSSLLAINRAHKSRALSLPAWTFVTLAGVLALTVLGVMLFSVLTGNSEAVLAWTRLEVTLDQTGIRGIGAAPALFALTLYALLPIVVNTFVGLRNVPDGVIDAARGMGMNASQVFWRAQVPIALPFLFEGLRGALVLAFGIATVAALIGGGGLGFFILRGVEGNVPDLVLLGALPVTVIALLLDTLMRALSMALTPKGLR